MKKGKVAVQFFGHLRTFEKCIGFQREYIFNEYDCDIFIHTWDQTEHSNRAWYDESIRSEVENVGKDILDRIVTEYNPKSFLIEKQDFIDEPGFFGTHPKIQISLQGFKYMLYSQSRVNQLRLEYQRENEVEYDYVIFIRPDILPLEPLNIDKFENEFSFYDKTSIHLIHNSVIKLKERKFFNYPLVFDCFFFSKPEVADIIADCYHHFDRFFKDIKNIFPPGVENPESAINEYLLQNGVIPRQYSAYFAIKRKRDTDDIKLIPDVSVLDQSLSFRGLYYKHSKKFIIKYYLKKIIKRFYLVLPSVMKIILTRPLIWCQKVLLYLEKIDGKVE